AQRRGSTPVVDYLSGGAPGFLRSIRDGFPPGAKRTGFVDGQNVLTEYRWAEGRYDRLPAMAADLVHRKVDVITASGGDAAIACGKGCNLDDPDCLHRLGRSGS